MGTTMTNGEILSFIDLLDKHKIEIPIIQRDYAQGREENRDIRCDFLNALKNSIENNKEIKLDFVYGELLGDVFQPLDGQQRLTTLFLLHWYAAVKDATSNNDVSSSVLNRLSKFTYETRLSTRYFCNCLVEQPIVFDSKNNVSGLIKDSSWFYISWVQDPSIKAMLNTIDDIHEIFNGIDSLLELLVGQKLIKFHYLNLHDLGLSDDLYIKMNARGKLLTTFENLKAQIQMKIEDGKWEEKYEITNKFDYKIDTDWAEFFWSMFQDKMDAAHINFITTVIMCIISLNKDKHPDRLYMLRRLNDNIDAKYLIQYIDKEVYNYIYSCYELLKNADTNEFDLSISAINFWSHSCPKGVLREIGNDSSSYTKKALLYAQIEFLRKTDGTGTFNRSAYEKWMRVIRNFVCFANVSIKANSSREDLLRAPDTFESMIAMIHFLAEGYDDIYAFLTNLKNPGAFRREQMAEEIKKAKLISETPILCNVIWKLEDLSLFRGRISFVFDCLNSMPLPNTLCEVDQLERLYNNVFAKHFDEGKFDEEKFNRSMFTLNVNNSYEYYNYWASTWYAMNAEKRKFVVNLIELNYYIYCERGESKEYIKQLCLLLLSNDYQDIINNFDKPDDMPMWKATLIKDPAWFQNRKSDFFAITSDGEDCYLLKSQRPLTPDGGQIVS